MSFRRGRGNSRRDFHRSHFHKYSRNDGDIKCDHSRENSGRGNFEQTVSWQCNNDPVVNQRENSSQSVPIEPMDEESEIYFQIVYERMNEPFENDEEKDLFLVNVVEQMSGKEFALAVRSLGSRTLQTLLSLSNSQELIEKLLIPLQPDVEELCVNQYGSLVIECLLMKSLKFVAAGNIRGCFSRFVISVAECCMQEFPSVLDHQFQNYVLKTLIHVLSGNISYSNNNKKLHLLEVLFVDVPESFSNMFAKLTLQALSINNLQEWLLNERFSLSLQHLLKGSKNFPDLQQQIVERVLIIILETEAVDGNLHPLLTNPVSSHIFQAVAEVFNRKQRRTFLKKFVNNNLEKLVEDKYANNIIRVLIKATAKKNHFEKFFDKLEPSFGQIFHLEHDSLFVAIADCCLKFDVCQARFVSAMKTALQCNKTDKHQHFLPCLLHMLTFDQYVIAEADNTAKLSLNGSLLVQRLLNFSKPIKFVMTIINMDFDLLKRILCDFKGCHLVDSFMGSKTVGEKSRDKFVSKVRDISITLACCAPGSRCIDAIWRNANTKQKMILADALAKNAEVLQSNHFGRFVHRNLALGHFKKRLDDWKQVQTTQDKKHKLFQDILCDTEPVQTKKLKEHY